HLAKSAGIPLSESDAPILYDPEGDLLEDWEETEGLPSLPPEIYEYLPEFLKRSVSPAENESERDLLLLGSLAVISACLPVIYGCYDGFEVYSNLYLYVTAGPSSGKGRLNLCKRLVLPIHQKLRKEANEMKVLYDSVMADDNKVAEKPEKPK